MAGGYFCDNQGNITVAVQWSPTNCEEICFETPSGCPNSWVILNPEYKHYDTMTVLVITGNATE